MELSLALGGGGAKGIAHLGVVEGLRRRGVTIRAIAGTSVGGLIGALIACGHSPLDLCQRFAALDQRQLFGHTPGQLPSLLGLSGLEQVLVELIGDRDFRDLSIPLAVTAVDIRTSRMLVLRSGRVLDAVLATIAIPGIFPPRPWGGDGLLVDGGIINPVPVDVARRQWPRWPVVAVPLTNLPEGRLSVTGAGLLSPIRGIEYLTRLRMGQALTTFLAAWDSSSRLLTQLRLQKDPPDVILTPDVEDIQLLGRVNVEEVYARGLAAAAEGEEEIQRLFSWQQRALRTLNLSRPPVRPGVSENGG